MNEQSKSLAKQLISAIAHTANYLRISIRRVESLENSLFGIEDQLSDIKDCLNLLPNHTPDYGTEEYWKHQRVEIIKTMLAGNNFRTYSTKEINEAIKDVVEVSNIVIEALKSSN